MRTESVSDRTEPGRIQPDDPAALAVRTSLAEGLKWLLVNESVARSGDSIGVHHLRTTTRRLRTALKLFATLIESTNIESLSDDLKWLAGLLGDVRDLDVLADRFRTGSHGQTDALAPLFMTLSARHAAASDVLQAALRSDRYESIKDRLAATLDAIPVSGDGAGPCRSALPPRVARLWKSLRKGGRALQPESPDTDFHEVRKLAKRARYAAESIVDALDSSTASDARRFIRRARAVQDVLGVHQDSVIAADEVFASAADHPDLGPFNFAAGRLLEHHRRAADDSRAAFFDAWDALDRKKVVRWLKP